MGVMETYLAASEVIDWEHPEIMAVARNITSECVTPKEKVKVCFEWVRDHILHTYDHQIPLITCRASEVIINRTGFCYAKSHLLAALLRANHIPAGFCYQRLSINNQGSPYCLHGFNGVYLPSMGWYRMDPRGNKEGIDAQFTPPIEQLAYQPLLPGEMDFSNILEEPLPWIVKALQENKTLTNLMQCLPDVSLVQRQKYHLNEIKKRIKPDRVRF